MVVRILRDIIQTIKKLGPLRIKVAYLRNALFSSDWGFTGFSMKTAVRC